MSVADILDHKGRTVETIRPDPKVLMPVHRLRMQNVGALVRPPGRRRAVRARRRAGLTRHGGDLVDMSGVAVMSRGVTASS